MFLRSIYAFVGAGGDIAGHTSSDFGFASWASAHFVQSRFRKWRIPTEGFHTIGLRAGSLELQKPEPVHDKTFRVPFDFDEHAWRTTQGSERHEFYLDLYQRGFEVAAAHQPLPLERLLALLDEFRGGGYRNVWIGAKKQIRKPNPAGATLRAALVCELTLERFTLGLQVRVGEELRFDEQLLVTKPDPLCWHHKWKSIEIDGEDLVVRNRMYRDTEVRRVPLSQFAGGVSM